MSSTATVLLPTRSRLVILAGSLALLGSFVLPAQAGYYDEPYPVYRRYGWPAHRHPYYRTWSRPYPWGYGGEREWRAPYAYRYDPYARVVDPEPRPFPWGYGGVRDWRPPSYTYRYDPYAAYESPPRPPAPIWNVGDY
jgi:hypothetical protein